MVNLSFKKSEDQYTQKNYSERACPREHNLLSIVVLRLHLCNLILYGCYLRKSIFY